MQVSVVTHESQVTFGGLYYCDERRMLLADSGKAIGVRNKTLAVFKLLADHYNCVLSRREIIDRIWGETFVSDDSLTQCICEIRRLLGDNAFEVLKTHPRRGYVLVPDHLVVRQHTVETPVLETA